MPLEVVLLWLHICYYSGFPHFTIYMSVLEELKGFLICINYHDLVEGISQSVEHDFLSFLPLHILTLFGLNCALSECI